MSEGSLSAALFKRLDLFGQDDEKFTALCTGIADVVGLEDPTGFCLSFDLFYFYFERA